MACLLDGDALRGGEMKLGFCLTYPAPGILEAVAADWDWFWLDGQHGQLDYDTLLHCVRTADALQTPPVVRVRDHSFASIGPILDMDCAGIIVPMVNTAEQARAVVDNAKFPPLGLRSYGGRRVFDRGGRDYWATANEECLLIVQIETAQAVENIEEIVAVPGIDGIFFGPDDLKQSLGLPMDTPSSDPAIAERLERAATATAAAGKIPGAAGAATGEWARRLKDMGFTLIACTGDVVLIRNNSPLQAAEIRQAIAGAS